MHTQSAPVYLYSSPVKADLAIQALGRSGFDLTQLSLIGKICPNGDHALGAQSSVASIRAPDGPTAIGHNVWQLLAAPDVYFLPGTGTLAMTGPVVQTLVGQHRSQRPKLLRKHKIEVDKLNSTSTKHLNV